jgi:hypothetical protein
MSEIVREVARKLGWNDHYALAPKDPDSQLLKDAISDAVAEYHIQNNVSGIVLCHKCHNAEHGKYNL